jgi:hypothetical protein
VGELKRSPVLFCVVAAVHFVLSVAGTVLALPAAFALQQGFWTAPVKIALAWTAGILLSPLMLVPVRGDFGYLEIGAVSVLFGLAAVALAHIVRRLRSPRPS